MPEGLKASIRSAALTEAIDALEHYTKTTMLDDTQKACYANAIKMIRDLVNRTPWTQ